MNRIAVLIAVLTLSTTAAFAAEGTFEKTLDVHGAPTLKVETGAGNVHVYVGSDTQIHVIGRVHTRPGFRGNESDAEARVRQIVADPPIKQSGNSVTIGADHGNAWLYRGERDLSIDYEITAPRSTELKAESGAGNIDIGGIQGIVKGTTGAGNITVDNIGGNARIETGAGNIRVSNLHGAASFESGAGNLDLDLTGAGDVKAETGAGSIRITGASGGLSAESGAGSIDVTGDILAEWHVVSGSGNIHINLGSTAKFNLNAKTRRGSIHTELPILMQGSLDKQHITGTVNGGGPTLHAETGSGSIEIR